MYRVLLITDESSGRKTLKSWLLEQGFGVSVVGSASLTDERATPPKADVVVADLEQSPQEPARLCRLIQRERAFRDVPLVLLIPEEQLSRLDFAWGLDDYLTLPVSPLRLAERLKFLLWKLHQVALKNGLKVGELSIDFERYEVRAGGELLDLTYKEFELLKFLAMHQGKVFTREALLDKVWGYDYYGGTRTVDVHVRRLRSKLEVGGRTYIETVRNVGYKFLGEAV